MFAFAAHALISTGRELAKIPAHYEQWDLAWQQDVCARLIDAYRTFAKSEHALHTAHREVADLASRSTVPTKVVMRNKLGALQGALIDFGDCVVTAYGLQHKQKNFLQSDLLVQMVGPKSRCVINPLTTIHLYALTCPEGVFGSDRETAYIRYPTIYPANHLVNLDRYRRDDQLELSLDKLKIQILTDLHENLGYKLVDIRDADSLTVLLEQYPTDVAVVQEVRQQLAQAIHQTYALDRLLG